MQLPSLLGHAQELLGLVRASERPADSLMDGFFRSHKYLGSNDRRFIAQSVYGTLRHLRRCEGILYRSLGSNAESLGKEDGLLLLIVVFLLTFEGEPKLDPEAVKTKLAEPTLRNRCDHLMKRFLSEDVIARQDTVELIGVSHSFPDWMVRRFIAEYGSAQTETLCKSLNEQAPLTLRVNTIKTSIDECQVLLKSEGIETTRTHYSPVGLHVRKRINIFQMQAFQMGLFEVQDEGSQILTQLIDPKPTIKLLDACAGAGGKSLALAALMKNRGAIYAADTNKRRLAELKKRSKRANAFNIRSFPVHSLEELNKDYKEFFDIVLVDAPCSGIGTIRRNPGMKWLVTEQTVNEISEKQKVILRQSSDLVKPGGIVAYATCTLLRQENEDIVDQFLASTIGFVRKDPSLVAEKAGIHNCVEGGNIKLLPNIHGTDGFFLSMMEKKTEN
jgi:16S rRNA (cytosine967-C5)-methyltransferase